MVKSLKIAESGGYMRYRCLVLDHDDTAVKSTPTINYPSFLASLAILRPGYQLSFEEFMHYCYDPGFHGFLTDILKYTPEEVDFEFKFWQDYIKDRTPDFYEGIPELCQRQKDEGGLLCVISHSSEQNILRDYRAGCKVVPDLIFGYELGEQRRKPHPYPMEQVMKTYNLRPEEILMVDDLIPGLKMCRCCKVDFAYAGWTITVKEIADMMKKEADITFNTVAELAKYQFGN